MKTIQFSKMHGLGNDFMVLNGVKQHIDMAKLPIPIWANRHIGIGFDQLLLIAPSSKADFACRIFNADGSEVEQCGNGLRCVARFIADEGLTQQNSLTLETLAGVFKVALQPDQQIQTTLGVPTFQPAAVPFITDSQQTSYVIPTPSNTEDHPLVVLSLGNPHAIMQVTSVQDFPVAQVGKELATHPAFPHSVNVGFMEIITRQHIRLRTFERGVGETFACGSNACAAVVAGIIQQRLDQKVKVELAFGDLSVEWLGADRPVTLTGPATRVFDGTLTL